MALAVHGLPKEPGRRPAQTPSPETLEEFKALAAGGSDDDDVVIVADPPEEGEEVALTDDVEVVDDTPDPDKGRSAAPLDSNYDEEDKDIEQELLQIQGARGLKQRIPAVIKQRNDERRAKEAEARARIEATNFARSLYERNKILEKMLEDASTSGTAAAKNLAKLNIETARKQLRDANEAGDFDQITKAQEELNRAVINEAVANNARPATPPPMPAAPSMNNIDNKTQEWMTRNTWFNKHGTLTQASVDFHNEAVRKGLTPSDDSYYSYIDEKMKPLLSAYGLAPPPSGGKIDPPRKGTVEAVTPVSRSSGAAPKREAQSPKTFTLTRSQAQLAVDLMPDIPPAEARRRYAIQMAKKNS